MGRDEREPLRCAACADPEDKRQDERGHWVCPDGCDAGLVRCDTCPAPAVMRCEDGHPWCPACEAEWRATAAADAQRWAEEDEAEAREALEAYLWAHVGPDAMKRAA